MAVRGSVYHDQPRTRACRATRPLSPALLPAAPRTEGAAARPRNAGIAERRDDNFGVTVEAKRTGTAPQRRRDVGTGEQLDPVHAASLPHPVASGNAARENAGRLDGEPVTTRASGKTMPKVLAALIGCAGVGTMLLACAWFVTGGTRTAALLGAPALFALGGAAVFAGGALFVRRRAGPMRYCSVCRRLAEDRNGFSAFVCPECRRERARSL